MLAQEKLLQAIPAIERYAATVLAVVCTLAIRLVLDPMLGDRAPYLFFLLTIVIVKRLWGRGPGLLATLLGGLASWYFIIEPRFSFAIASRADALNLSSYFVVGVGISLLGETSGFLPASVAAGGRIIKLRVFRQTAVLAGAGVVLAGMVFLLLRDFERTQVAEGWVTHTYQVIDSTEWLLSMMKDAEAGERGYLLTGDETYLAPYNSAIAALPGGLQELKDLTSDNPEQQARCKEINRLTDESLSVLRRAVELRKAMQIDAALAVVRSGEGDQSLNDLRSTLDTVMREERRLLRERTAQAAMEDSRERWVLGLGSGALILLLVFASVVIERETVRREEITQTLRRHADLLEQAHDSLLTFRFRGPIDYWSRGAETLYGYTREEAVGRSSHELLQTYHPLGMTQIDALLVRDGRWKGELTQTTKNGQVLNIEAQWTLAVDAQGIKTVLEANRDITERKKAEEALRVSEVRLRRFYESGLLGVIYWNADGQITDANDKFLETLGYTRDDLKAGRVNWIGITPPQHGRRDDLSMEELRATGVNKAPFEKEYFRKDGTRVPVLVAGAMLDEARVNGVAFVLDITERKRAEAERVLLSTAIEQAAETVVITDRNATIQYANPAFTRTTGYTRGEALGQNPRILKSGQHDSKFYQQMWSTLTAGKLWREEVINRRKDGRLYTEEATIAPVRNASGEITNYIAIKSDITERKRGELALRESEMMLRFFVQHAPAAIAMFDREMRYLVVSQRWMTDYQLGNRDLRGLSHYEVFPEMSDRWIEVHQRCLAGAVERCEEDPFPRPDGRIDWVRWEVRPWRKIDDSIGGIIIFSEVITERKRAEEALAESELRYRQLFERSESALALHEMIFEAQGNPCDYRFLDVNPAFERSTGLTRNRVVGRRAREVLPDLEDYWIQFYGRVATTGEPAVFENYARSLGRYYAGSAYSPRPNQFAVSFMDVTERRRAEEDVRLLTVELEQRVRSRTAALEVANRELEAFAHSVSHDLRAPLRGIDGWSLALLEDCGDRLDAQGHKYLDRVRSEAQRMGTLIDDLLHLSRVSRSELVLRTVDLTSLAGTIIARLKEAHPDRIIEFIVAPQLQCTGDSRLLEIALTNLLNNAVKFTGPRASARVEFGQTECEGKPAFFVRDDGVGFDMAYAKLLFAPFQRLHKTSEFPGTGIGLATVQRVIHRHGGRIWAEARVGAGATIFFTLGADG